MRYRKMINGDYCFGHSSSDYVEGLEAVAQNIKTRLLLFYNEWWENLENGLPVFEKMLGAPGTPQVFNSVNMLIQSRILETYGVTNVKEFESTYSNRQLTLYCKVDTKYGDTTINLSF